MTNEVLKVSLGYGNTLAQIKPILDELGCDYEVYKKPVEVEIKADNSKLTELITKLNEIGYSFEEMTEEEYNDIDYGVETDKQIPEMPLPEINEEGEIMEAKQVKSEAKEFLGFGADADEGLAKAINDAIKKYYEETGIIVKGFSMKDVEIKDGKVFAKGVEIDYDEEGEMNEEEVEEMEVAEDLEENEVSEEMVDMEENEELDVNEDPVSDEPEEVAGMEESKEVPETIEENMDVVKAHDNLGASKGKTVEPKEKPAKDVSPKEEGKKEDNSYNVNDDLGSKKAKVVEPTVKKEDKIDLVSDRHDVVFESEELDSIQSILKEAEEGTGSTFNMMVEAELKEIEETMKG
jgi:hypothetical protein